MKLLQKVSYQPFPDLPEVVKIGFIASGPYYSNNNEIYEVLFDTDDPRPYPKLKDNETVLFLSKSLLKEMKMGWTKLLDDKNEEVGIVGDEAWDIMGQAMANLVKCYQENFNRLPNEAELEQILNFTLPDGLKGKVEIHCQPLNEVCYLCGGEVFMLFNTIVPVLSQPSQTKSLVGIQDVPICEQCWVQKGDKAIVEEIMEKKYKNNDQEGIGIIEPDEATLLLFGL